MADSKGPVLGNVVMQGLDQGSAISVNDHIYLSWGTSSSYLVTTDDGDVLINAGMHVEGDSHKQRFGEVSANPLRKIIFTQSHPDHIGGWPMFNGPGIETIVQSNYDDVRGYWTRLAPFYWSRSAKLWARDMANPLGTAPPSVRATDPVITTTFDDSLSFELGGRRFELYSVDGGETTDSLAVWLPDEKVAFVGNMMGPLYGHIPNLYTIRGDKIRSALSTIRSIDRVRALQPELLLTGHGDPIRGADEIESGLRRVRDALEFVQEQTFDGMNNGVDLFTLMDRIKLPPELEVGEGHGKVSWAVRAIWEEYVGWFRFDSTTALYAVPPTAVWADLVELSGVDGLNARATKYLGDGRPLEALHLTDIVLSSAADNEEARRVRRGALQELLERSGGQNFSEVRWLEAELSE